MTDQSGLKQPPGARWSGTGRKNGSGPSSCWLRSLRAPSVTLELAHGCLLDWWQGQLFWLPGWIWTTGLWVMSLIH